MPLPTGNTTWPPATHATIFSDMQTWEAWWSGDTMKLWNLYHGKAAANTTQTRGLLGFASRFFWGRKTAIGNMPSRSDLHIPIASDICATSADLLYATPPTITTPSQATNEQIERYIDDGLFDGLLASAETGAALGGRYVRVTWDESICERPFLSTVDADKALPEFRWGRLVAVTFWTVLASDGNLWLRHLERHELDPAGNGVVYHGLYEGTSDNLGHPIPLDAHPATVPLARLVDDQAKLTTSPTPGLCVAYIPNITPQRRWRTNPHGHDLGRSDLDGLEALMDALDETYTAWMRDIRLGKARIFADRNMLESAPTRSGNTPTFNLDQEVFTPLDGLAGSMANAVPITPQQFTIRWQEHQATALDLTRRIIRAARYSNTTFGDDGDAEITATEVKARQNATNTTRERKIRLEKPALQSLIVKMLRVDQAVFHTPALNFDDLTVKFPKLIEDTTEGNAQTVSTLRGAQVMSLETAVRMAHPDWDTSAVNAEVQALKSEHPLPSPDEWRPQSDHDHQ